MTVEKCKELLAADFEDVEISSLTDITKVRIIGTIPFQQMDIKKLEERKSEKQAEMERCTHLRSMLYEDLKDGMISVR